MPLLRESLVELGLVPPRPEDPPPTLSTSRLRVALLAAIVLGACLALAIVAALGVTPRVGA